MAVIRTARVHDIPALLRIYSPYVTDTAATFEYEVPAPAVFTARYIQVTKTLPWLVCEINGVVAGYVYASRSRDRVAYQWDADIAVYIDSEYHRYGIASALYRCMEDLVRRQGYVRLYAHITGANKGSIAFHEALGYIRIAVLAKTGYKMGVWHDVIWYERILVTLPDIPVAPVVFSALDPVFTAETMEHYAGEIRG